MSTAEAADLVTALVIGKLRRVPSDGVAADGDGSAAARQFDAVLITAGFKLSGDLMEYLSGCEGGYVLDTALRVLPVVRQLTGDHVQHNVYFKRYPEGVPDTLEFWAQCLHNALAVGASVEGYFAAEGGTWPGGMPVAEADREFLAVGVPGGEPEKIVGWVNLLSLPDYGKYLHSYEEMLAAHEELIPALSDRVTVLFRGGTLMDEATALYHALAGTRVPLAEEDLSALSCLAGYCIDAPQPEKIPVRENMALVNTLRLAHGRPLIATTVTDVLRLACALSDGDVTLREKTRFRSFSRRERRALLTALDQAVRLGEKGDNFRFGDVHPYREQWKRLGERLHPHEYPGEGAREVFRVARGESAGTTVAGQAELSFQAGEPAAAAGALSTAPGMLWRSADRLLRTEAPAAQRARIQQLLREAAPKASGRVLMGAREHFQNRLTPADASRIFANRKGRAWVTGENRGPIEEDVASAVLGIIDAEVARRLPWTGQVLFDPAILDVALPLSGKAAAPGLGVLPRGSVAPVTGELLRFFVHWKQRAERTDYDLSAMILDEHYGSPQWVSWTSYRAGGYATYSGDITSAPDGASEFIDIQLGKCPRQIIIPQVLIYAGESFDEAEEAFFGFMERTLASNGAPFEAKTVRMKSDLRGSGRVALPLAFTRGDDGNWQAKWLHLYQRGRMFANTVEGNRLSANMLVQSIIERDYLRVGYIARLLQERQPEVTTRLFNGTVPDKPVTFIGLERPEGLAAGSVVITPGNLADLMPA